MTHLPSTIFSPAADPLDNVAVDGRSLRRTNRKAQLNISVSPATKSAFWTFAKEHGYQIGGEALLALLRKVVR